MRNRFIMYILITVMLLTLCSCHDISDNGISPVNSPSTDPSPEVTTATPSIEPSATEVVSTSTPGPEPTATPTPSQPPQRPIGYTDERYFRFDALHGIILDYDMTGGIYVSIPETINGFKVTTIGEHAFQGRKLYGVVLPDSVTKISAYAFENCDISELDLGKGVEYIGEYAFSTSVSYKDNTYSNPVWAEGLKTLTLPDTVKHIGNNAFCNNSLTSINLPNGLEYLSGFNGNKLTHVEIPGSVKTVGDYAFSDNLLTSVTVPDSVVCIGVKAFQGLTEDKVKLGAGSDRYFVVKGDSIVGHICTVQGTLTVPYYEGVSKIGFGAFWGQKGITKVKISEGIKIIEDYAFRDTSLNRQKHSVWLPESIQFLPTVAFEGSPKFLFEYADGSFVKYLVNGPDYEDISATNYLYNFPLERKDIVAKDIAIDMRTENTNYGIDWIRRYVCSKYVNYKINSCNVSISDSEVHNIRYSFKNRDSHILIAQQYRISVNAANDIEGMTRGEANNYDIMLQAVFVADNINNRFVLSGIIPENEMIDSSKKLYDYVKTDGRFSLGAYVTDTVDVKAIPTLAKYSDRITSYDLKDSKIISELTKDITFEQTHSGPTEKYLPVGKDKVVFFLPEPVSKLYMVNYRTNEIIWSKDYPDTRCIKLDYTDRYSGAADEVIMFYYTKNIEHLYDYIDTKGEYIAKNMPSDAYEKPIPGTKWRAINENYSIHLKDTKTDTVYTVLSANIADWPVKDYLFQKALDENRFVYQKIHSGEGMLYFNLYAYDIRDGSSTAIGRYDRDRGYYIFSNEADEFVTSAAVSGGAGSQATMYIYNDEKKEAVDIKSLAEDFPYIVDYSLSKDGRYVAILTGESGYTFELVWAFVADHILLIDLKTKEVLLQDSVTLNGGQIFFLPDNTLAVNDGKMLMYIDVSGIN